MRNKKNAETIARAEASGQLPHEFLLFVSQGHTVDDYKPTFEERIKAAIAAAPFFAPKLTASENKNEHKGSLLIATGVPRNDDEDDNDD